MSRTLSSDFIGAAFSQETDKALVVLLTITPPAGYDAPAGSGYNGGVIRVSNYPATRYSDDPLRYGTTSRGQQFLFYPFQITLPEEGEEAQPTMQIVLDNVDREVTVLLASLAGYDPATVTVECVLSSSPDTVEFEFPDFDLVSSTVNTSEAVLSLSLDSMVTEPYPGWDFTPEAFGGLFASA